MDRSRGEPAARRPVGRVALFQPRLRKEMFQNLKRPPLAPATGASSGYPLSEILRGMSFSLAGVALDGLLLGVSGALTVEPLLLAPFRQPPSLGLLVGHYRPPSR